MSIKINTSKIAKQYEGEWIFKSISLSFSANNCYHLAGPNGSGKSTLMKLLAGYVTPSKGEISWEIGDKKIHIETLNKEISWCAPYLELFPHLSLKQMFDFVNKNQPILLNSALDFAKKIELESALNKPLRNFSSGMLQRVKLGFALINNCAFCFLDEPCSNLDKNAIDWFQKTLLEYKNNRLVIIASNNQSDEIFCCNSTVDVTNFKE